VRLQTRSGQWLILHGADVSERGHTPNSTSERPDQARTGPSGPRRIAVLIEPARPPDVLPLIEQAYGLTPRECEVVRLVLTGASSAELAQALCISPYTVQDHLKTVFCKVGVRSRRDLVARFLGGQYFPRLLTGVPPGPSGWFSY
ncbi:MAG TPA: helix-turn-helix transcriptional regulator, partial [Chloroflexota bacterium]|nr:helix-turn-helix transcriptional regulator [Chloroflexota bacterium]